MNSNALLQSYKDILKDLPVSHVWNGHGSAIFLELGELSFPEEGGKLKNAPDGQYTIMIEWDWRIEHGRKIISGSSLESTNFMKTLGNLVGSKITYFEAIGFIPEIKLKFSNGYIIRSFMTSDDDPQWAIIDNRSKGLPTLMVENGTLASE